MTSQRPSGDGTIAKALDVLDLVAEMQRPVRFAEILAQVSIPKATLYRLFQTLTAQGMLQYDVDRQTYAPGLRLVRLAHSAWRQSSLAPIARPYIDKLAEKAGETIHLAQMDNGQVLYVDKRNASSPIEMFSQAGKVGPGYCTGVGKAMLAFMAQELQSQAIARQSYYAYTANTLTSPETLEAELVDIRAEGFAYDREEHEPGIICIAAPILSNGTRVIGALSVTTSVQRSSLKELKKLKPDLFETAQRIAEAATTWQFPEPERG
ncbi:MAG: IclR family transcriptional regulator [Paracoccaceae bacterium]